MTNQPVLRRDTTHQVVGGVCGGLARTWNVDPLLVRVAFIVASLLTNGAVILVYIGLWVALPADGRSPARRLTLTPTTILLLSLAVILLLGLTTPRYSGAVGGFLLLALGAIWYYIFSPAQRARPTDPRSPAPLAQPTWQQPTWQQPPSAPAFTAATGTRGGTPAERRIWIRILLACALSWGLLGLAAASGRPVSALAYSAGSLAVLALTLLWTARPSAARRSRPKGLLPAASLVALLTVLLMASLPSQTSTTPASAVAYERASDAPATSDLSVGTHTVDFSKVVVDTDRTLTVNLDVGELNLRLPTDANVVVHYRVEMGEVTTPDRSDRGTDLADDLSVTPNPDAPTLTFDVRVGVGRLVMSR